MAISKQWPTAHSTTIQNSRMRLLNKLKENEKPMMTFMAIPSVRMAQIVALTGLDVSVLLGRGVCSS